MSTQEQQWDEAYGIAENMYNAKRPFKRTNLNCFQQIVCSRFCTIFDYDPYQDEYKFINQVLEYEQPVTPRCRNIAEADLDLLKNNAVKSQLKPLSYINITPIYVVPPSTILVFNNSQVTTDELNNALQNASTSLTLNPTPEEITPGIELVFKHKNGKCYRCIVISEVFDEAVPDSERRYEVAFLDHCQIVPVKLKTLFIPRDVTMENYPCALQCIRPVGVAAFRSGFLTDYNNEVRAFYNDKDKRKTGLVGLLYKTDKKERKLIMDFPSIHGHPYTNSEEVKMQHGHQSTAKNDPIAMKYEQLVNREVVRSLEYDEDCAIEDKDSEDHEKPEVNKSEDDDDVELDLTDSDCNTDKVSIPTLKEVQNAACPMGLASIAKFMQQGRQQVQAPESTAKNLIKTSPDISFSSSFRQNSSPQEQHDNRDDGGILDNTCNESVSSLRSATINQIPSSNPTPQPTFDEPVKGESTPKKLEPTGNGSSDGWGDDTPKKEKEVNNENIIEGREQSNDFKEVTQTFKVASSPDPVIDSSSKPLQKVEPLTAKRTPSPQSIQRPLSPTPQFKKRQALSTVKPVLDSLMNMKIVTPEKFKSNDIVAPLRTEDTKMDKNENLQKLPSVSGIMNSENRRPHPFGQPPTKSEIDRSSKLFGIPSYNESVSEIDSSLSRNVFKPSKQSTLEDDVFSSANNAESSETMIHQVDDMDVCQDANISKTSTNQLLISTAQENFHDIGDDEWEPQVGQKPASQTNGTGKIIEIEGQMVTVFPGATSVESVVDDNFSRRSVCSGDFNDVVENCPEWECEADSKSGVAVDEFANVADNLKQLASAFLCSIRDAAIQKNHNVYMIEVMAFEVMSLKMSNDLDKRFMRAKLTEAKSLDQAFD